jgi:hypothetical protein
MRAPSLRKPQAIPDSKPQAIPDSKPQAIPDKWESR